MRLTTLIILTACLSASARGTAQTIKLDVKDAPLERVFAEIKKQSGYSFVYYKEDLAHGEKITLRLASASIDEILQQVLKDQPLNYKIVDKVIVISRRSPNDTPGHSGLDPESFPPPIDIHGRIVNENGEPVLATIQVKGTNKGTTTNSNGYFELKNVDDNATLVISATNIETKEIKLNGKSDLNVVNVKMKISPLDEMQVIAYGKSSKRFQTGNVATVKAADIEKQPVSNPLLALQGRVPGLQITQATGMPGSGVTVRIQGQNSLRQGSDPLYVIDGMPYSSQMNLGISDIIGRSGVTSVGSGTGNPLSYINPADIESIEVLKDADATSIYGSRAAAGAILITTKKGKAGKTRVDVNIQSGVGKVAKFMRLLNTDQYLEMRNEAYFKNDGLTTASTAYKTAYDINGVWDQNRYTDWQKFFLGGTAHYSDANLSLSGGAGNTTFLIGAFYHRETTVLPGDLSDQKISLHSNLSHSSTNRKFNVTLDTKYMADDNRLIWQDLTRTAILLPPNAPALYNKDGSLNWAPDSLGNSTWKNPLVYLLQKYKGMVNNLIGNALVSYNFSGGFEFKANFGYTDMRRNELFTSPKSASAPDRNPVNFSRFGDDRIMSWNIEPQLNYLRDFGFSSLNVLIGTTFFYNKSSSVIADAQDFSSDLLLEDIGSAGSVTYTTTQSKYKYNGAFGRINYKLKDKYILDLTARRDGSSRFGPANRFNNFGSIGGAWIFSSEKFIQKKLDFLSFGKLKGSFGTTGNDQIGDYQYIALYNSISRQVPYQGVSGLSPSGFINPYLQWEETKKLQGGIELGLFKDRILMNVSYYSNTSSNQLLSYSLPNFVGKSSLTTNFPATFRNSGWELSLNTVNLKKGSVTWNSDINLTIPKSKLLKFPNLVTSTYRLNYKVGEPITIVRQFQSVGVDPATGLFTYLAANGSLTTSPSFQTDANVIVNRASQLFGGIQNTITFKNLSVDFLFQFDKINSSDFRYGSKPGLFSSVSSSYAIGNQPVTVMDRWQKPGDDAFFQRFSATYPSSISTPYSNMTSSTLSAHVFNTIRLRNASISYQLPQRWLNKIHAQQVRIYVQGENLWRSTSNGFVGFDPETGISSVPPLRVCTLGVQLSF